METNRSVKQLQDHWNDLRNNSKLRKWMYLSRNVYSYNDMEAPEIIGGVAVSRKNWPFDEATIVATPNSYDSDDESLSDKHTRRERRSDICLYHEEICGLRLAFSFWMGVGLWTCLCVCMQMYVHAYWHSCTFIHTYTHTYIYIAYGGWSAESPEV